MDYKEKYEQALERCKEEFNFNNLAYSHEEIKQKLKRVFPELKESEDENVRKQILDCFKTMKQQGCFPSKHKEQYDSWIAWLEKQGESDETKAKKFLINKGYPINTNGTFPTYEKMYNIIREGLEKQGEQNLPDNVKSKFKVGDWVVQGKMLYQIEKVTNLPDNHFQYWTTDGVWFGDGTEAHLWTIQDAKDGDVLANENMVLIFKCFEEPSYRQHIIAHIGLDTCGYIQITNDSWNLGLNGANPATKEQRDLLFQKMKEVGYEWDSEKKELKKIETNPTWCEEDEEMIKGLNNCLSELEEKCGWRYTYVNNKDVELDKIRNWLKCLRERIIDVI